MANPTALASLIQLDRPFDEKALRNLRNDAYRKGIPGLLIAGVESITGVFLMFHYGRVTTGGDLLNAATKLPPPYNNLQYVKPLEEGDHWNEAVSAFDGCDVSWRAKIRPVCSPCIYVKTLTGKTIEVQIPTSASIGNLKSELYRREGIPPDQIRLVYAGEDLGDSRTLVDYDISLYTTIHLVLRLRGGGGGTHLNFTGVNGNPRTTAYSKEAPQWRMVAPGLNLSGLCQNMNCNAFKKLVWVRKGVGIFTLSAMKDRLGILWAPCPECKTPTIMTGMGFCECLWEAWGGKIDKVGRMETFHKYPQKATDTFQSYNPSDNGKAQYSTLTIRTKRLNNTVTCAACGDEQAIINVMLDCSHGPVGNNCLNAVKDGQQKCLLCVRPPQCLLLETINSSYLEQGDRDIVGELESWVNDRQIEGVGE